MWGGAHERAEPLADLRQRRRGQRSHLRRAGRHHQQRRVGDAVPHRLQVRLQLPGSVAAGVEDEEEDGAVGEEHGVRVEVGGLASEVPEVEVDTVVPPLVHLDAVRHLGAGQELARLQAVHEGGLARLARPHHHHLHSADLDGACCCLLVTLAQEDEDGFVALASELWRELQDVDVLVEVDSFQPGGKRT